MLEEISKLQAQGLSPAKIAEQLNSQGMKTARGKPWAEHSVNYQLGKGKPALKSPAATKLKKTFKKNGSHGAPALATAKRAPESRVAARSSASAFAKAGAGMSLARAIEISSEILNSNDMTALNRAQVVVNLLESFAGL